MTAYEFRPDASIPMSRHAQEQLTLVQGGTVWLTVGCVHHRLRPGSWSVLPSNVEHGLTAGEDGAEVLAIEISGPQSRQGCTVIRAAGEGWNHPDLGFHPDLESL